MSDCRECGFHPAVEGEFCSDVCRVFWKRRTTDPMFWTNIPREPAEKKVMSEEVKEKLRKYKQTSQEEQDAANKAFEADEAAAAQELAKELEAL